MSSAAFEVIAARWDGKEMHVTRMTHLRRARSAIITSGQRVRLTGHDALAGRARCDQRDGHALHVYRAVAGDRVAGELKVAAVDGGDVLNSVRRAALAKAKTFGDWRSPLKTQVSGHQCCGWLQ